MTSLVALLFAIHVIRLLLPSSLDLQAIWMFGFIPARYEGDVLQGQFPGGVGADIWTFVTYGLLHADWSHIGFNVLWLLPFGSAVARRFGPLRFYLFMIVTAAAGAVAHLLTHTGEVAPMIGASAAVSGAMAAAIRFAFARGSFLSFGRRDGDAQLASQVPAQPLLRALRNPRVLTFLAIWFGINIVFGMGSIAVGAQSIAWQAHIGGFLAGLVLFSLFDPIAQNDDGG